jgi:hypothetical protein
LSSDKLIKTESRENLSRKKKRILQQEKICIKNPFGKEIRDFHLPSAFITYILDHFYHNFVLGTVPTSDLTKIV